LSRAEGEAQVRRGTAKVIGGRAAIVVWRLTVTLWGPAAVGSTLVITAVIAARSVALWPSTEAASVVAWTHSPARRKWGPHALQLLLLLIGEDGHQLALYFFFQVGDLLSLFARQVKLPFHGRRNERPAAAC
jgi:hypothetical protein